MILRLAVLVIIFATFNISGSHAQDEFSINFEASHIIGTGNLINVHRVPVIDTVTGSTILKDIQMTFGIAEDGSFVVQMISSQDSIPLPNNASNFIPGFYKDSREDCYIVSSGGVTSDGRTSGSIRSTGSSHTRINANWLSGPVENHPIVGGLQVAMDGQLQDGPSYGTVGEENLNGFGNGCLIGALQIGTSVTVTAYHNWDGARCNTSSFGQSNLTVTLVNDPTECSME